MIFRNQTGQMLAACHGGSKERRGGESIVLVASIYSSEPKVLLTPED